jgi:hypothetical protein
MSLILAKQCTDGIVLVSDSVRIVEKHDAPPEIGSGDRKLIAGLRNGRNYGIVFAGLATMDELLPVRAWLEKAARSPGHLGENVTAAFVDALAHYKAHANWDNDMERESWEARQAFCYAFLAEGPGLLFYSDANFVFGGKTAQVNFGEVMILTPPDDPQASAAIRELKNDSPLLLKDGLLHLSDLFDRVVQAMPNGCKYPGHYWFVRQSGIAVYGEFASLAELQDVASKI